MLLIQNGRVLDPYTRMDALCDVLIGDDGVISAGGGNTSTPAGAARCMTREQADDGISG